ncbi:hypothetical protein [Leekyejoonella antrihumi]|uniref:Tyr recombinase domain-containing protein n=1 Tax=Leekyejoonella antrihumi TaxID=1660198 RepID=A0A563E2I3_9MICO|nr:hypothetical protein [Leekyejoonella antrihumi]TWP36402.1 hypothetical protein FGL98_10625 [Leekyejoonella antrihumi]
MNTVDERPPTATLTANDARVELAALAAEHADLPQRTIADNTRRYLQPDWNQYATWCARHSLDALPVDPKLVGMYVLAEAKLTRADGTPQFKASSIGRHVASIAWMAYQTGSGRGLGSHPDVANAVKAVRRTRQEPRAAKHPLLLNDVTALINAMDHRRWPAGVIAARDTLAILLGFTAALRRSEAAALTTAQLHPAPVTADGLQVRLGRSKTDQEGRGAVLGIPFGTASVTCVPCARIRWLHLIAAATRPEAMELTLVTPSNPADWEHVCADTAPPLDPSTPLLRPVDKFGRIGADPISGSGLNALLKRRLGAAGYHPPNYGWHSLRAGMVTQARRNGASTRAVRRQTRHTSDAMVDVYDRDWNPLDGSAVLQLGL